jgi:Bifunctional DNA primase/polymerase, N-terminal.
MKELIEAALFCKNLELSITAIKENKESVRHWKKYQHSIISDYEINCLFSDQQAFGIAVICGLVSKNLEVIDIDEKNDPRQCLFRKFIASIEGYNPALLSRLVIATTRNAGYHLFYRCNEIGNNLVLARRSSTKEELAVNPDQKVRVLIETRGEGGYVIIHPTPGYRFIQHSLADIPVIPPDDRRRLLKIATSFNRYKETQLVKPKSSVYHAPEISPFNDYNARGDIIALLERHGWTVVKTTELKTYFRRPGNTDHETSGDFHHELGLFSVTSTSTDFIPFTGYRPYAVFAILECNGNFKLAAKRLLKAGYGIPYKKSF